MEVAVNLMERFKNLDMLFLGRTTDQKNFLCKSMAN